MKLAVAALVILDLVLTISTPAHARAQLELPYSIADAFSTAVRFVRVDRNCKLIDKDPDAAFVTFACEDDGRTKRGTLELIRVGASLRAQLTLPDDTHGMELRWLELFERKLRDERGTPTPPTVTAPPKPQDAGAP
jgi:hypothetical protein